MSHVATVDVSVTNLDDLDAACKRLGLELVRGQQTYRWFGHSVGDYPLPDGFTAEDIGACEHAIRIPGNSTAYEVGVVRRRDGRPGYSLMWDFWQGGYGLQDLVGENCTKLKQAYALAAARRTAVAQGFAVSERQRADGSIELVCRK